MMTVDAPAWGQWTTFYDSLDQVPSMVRSDSEDGLVVGFDMDRMVMEIGGDQDAPFAGGFALSGALSVSMPDDFSLLGFLLIVRGTIVKSPRSQAAVSCSIAHSTHSIEWSFHSAVVVTPPTVGGTTPKPSDAEEEPSPEGSLLETDFIVNCIVGDTRPGGVGQPPFPQLPPLPITITVQARRRFVDEFVHVTITGFEALIVKS
jgi:hypothetical protein